jgi:transcription elongation factor/antiterminator RfaH
MVAFRRAEPHGCLLPHNLPTPSQEERWFLVHTLPRNEIRAEMHLSLQGFRVFFPRILKTIRHARKLRTGPAPFFPRYLFIALNLKRDRWLSVRSTLGVSALLTTGDGRPVPVPVGIVEGLIERFGNTNPVGSQEELTQGQRVQILSGPLAGLVGSLDRLDEKGRVRVLLEIMNSVVPVGIERYRLIPVP